MLFSVSDIENIENIEIIDFIMKKPVTLDKKTCFELNTIKNRKEIWEEVFLFVIALFLLFWNLGTRSLWSSEGRWAEITREMFIKKDFFHPTIAGIPYFDKPLLTYWAIAAFSAVTGRLDELIIRLPSAIAAFIAIACTVNLGKRLWSRKVGLLAGAFLLISYGLLNYARMASADTENLAAIMLAVTWYWIRRERPGFVSFIIFYLIIFIGSHMKGLTAFVIPVLVVLPDIIRQRKWRLLLLPSHLLAFTIGILVYLSPFIYSTLNQPESYQQNGLALVFQENIQRFFQPFDHTGPVYLYLYAVPLLILPWIPVFVGALITSIKNWKKLDYKTQWLTTAIALIFLFFTASGSRRDYYILPILPFCFLLTAVFIVDFSQEIVGKHRNRGLQIQKLVFIIIALLETTLAPLVVWFLINRKKWELPVMLGWSFFIIGILALAAGIFTDKIIRKTHYNKHLQIIFVSIIMATVEFGGLFAWQLNITGNLTGKRSFALQMKTIVESYSHERVAFYHRPDSKVLFYMKWNPPVNILFDENDIREFTERNEPGIIFSQNRYIKESEAKMLPIKSKFSEDCYTWESDLNKLKAWGISKDEIKTEMETNNAN